MKKFWVDFCTLQNFVIATIFNLKIEKKSCACTHRFLDPNFAIAASCKTLLSPYNHTIIWVTLKIQLKYIRLLSMTGIGSDTETASTCAPLRDLTFIIGWRGLVENVKISVNFRRPPPWSQMFWRTPSFGWNFCRPPAPLFLQRNILGTFITGGVEKGENSFLRPPFMMYHFFHAPPYGHQFCFLDPPFSTRPLPTSN